MAKKRRFLGALSGGVVTALALVTAVPAVAATPPQGRPTAVGHGGAVSSVDPDATAIGIEVLRRGGNAVDAAIATAAALGVTEPYSAGIGGGGFFVYYDAKRKKISTIDGRETAPASFTPTVFTENGTAIPFAEAVTSGLSVGVPGTPLTWQQALDTWGTRSLSQSLAPATALAKKGFVVDTTFRAQTAANAARFADFPATRALFLPGGQPPTIGTTLRNPDLARTYEQLARGGVRQFYTGPIGADVVRTAQNPPVDPAATRIVRKGQLTAADLARYTAPFRAPTRVGYRGLDVFSMAPPSSGGTTVGEALNILERVGLKGVDQTQYLHRYLAATTLAFADRNRWVGDPAAVDVPVRELLSDRFAATRACLVDPEKALTTPQAPGDPRTAGSDCAQPAGAPSGAAYEGPSTTHLTVADKWGNVVAYTLTIEQTGGSAITVPGRGFLLNNELTDFSFTPVTPGAPDPNLPGPGKRPRSSMAPTIVLDHGKPLLALGSPGGATIITTVLQVLLGRLDRGLTLPQAIAAPRASGRNGAAVEAEPGFDTAALTALGWSFTDVAEIGAVAAVEFLRDGRIVAAAEPSRRGGGSAAVVRP
ncbi:gamma-glutamyltransferase [Cryptosporangium aurantiacum]|uniref:Glutathione hydrolase proenzyme n=1 Tax=Cryptosporangium aurantiacum TaxID=134849 RepID=A0A1M7RHD1_9ACTN|nr:gamma-glutamyltransferase [Cryptosporangium aurantiacum]SHN45693.1 gamma-glutamyltranspeptidase / glutathione hydrolase [Cryptosporangium aurantiacum]